MSSLLIKILTWGLSYITNALTFIYIGKKNEQYKNQHEQLEAISQANSVRSNLKRDTSKRDKLHKIYKR